jgi:AraC family transcriptional regulator
MNFSAHCVSPKTHVDASAFAPPLLSSKEEGWSGGIFTRLRVPKMKSELYAYAGHMLAVPRSGEGYLIWQCDGKRGQARVQPGIVSVQPAGEFLHRCEMEGMICDTLVLAPTEMANLLEDGIPAGQGGLRSLPAGEDWLLQFWIDLLATCVPRRGEQGEPMMAEEILSRIGIHLFETHSTSPMRLRNYRRGLESWRLRRVCAFVEAHLSEPISLAMLANVAGGMSVYYFCRLFRQSTGLPPHLYVKRIRLNRARSLLQKGRADLLEVALQTGFCDHSHLTRSFKQLFGVSPSQFQRSGKSKNVQTRLLAVN